MGKRALPNRQLVVYGLYLLGGESRPVHTEDIALKCFELFPTSFSWVKHPHLPDKDIVRVALTDARKAPHGALVQGRAGERRGLAAKTRRLPVEDGWMLTPMGASWIKENRATLESVPGGGDAKVHRQRLLKQLNRTREHPLFLRYSENPTRFSAALGEIADLVRCRVDAESDVWQKRFDALEKQARTAGQDDVVGFVSVCRGSYEQQR